MGFRTVDGACRTIGTDNADGGNLFDFRFGVNIVYSCVGSSSVFWSGNL
jgi:hypothetical protein